MIPQSSDAVIVIKKNGTGEDGTVDRKIIRDAAVSSRAGVKSTYTNSQGHLVVVCENEAAKQRLVPNLKEKVKDREIVTPAQRTPTIRITGMDEQHNADTILNYVREQNQDRGIKIDENNFKVIHIRAHAKNPRLFQAVARVSNEVRAAIQNAGDKLHVGLTICPIFDHFHVIRCFRCQGFNHFMDKCSKAPLCGKCAGPHDTNDCTSGEIKCTNCVANRHERTNHPASDPNCASYLAAQKKLQETIGFYKVKN